jgi:hypothetical protein
MISLTVVLAAYLAAAGQTAAEGAPPEPTRVNVIDGADDRGSLLALGPMLGLRPTEIARIRRVSGYVGCLSPSPSMGAGALFLSNRQVLTAAHIFFEPSGRRRSRCFFRNQDPSPVTVDLIVEGGGARFGAGRPRAGSETDFAVVQLAEPVAGAEPFPALASAPEPGERLIVVTAHPAGMAREVDKGVPVVQGCTVRRALRTRSVADVPTFRTDCDATGSSSGGLNLVRAGGGLHVAGITISTGAWRDRRLEGAPYDEKRGSLTVALAVAGRIAAAGADLAAAPPVAAPRRSAPLAVTQESPAAPDAPLLEAPTEAAGREGAVEHERAAPRPAWRPLTSEAAAGDPRRGLGLGLESDLAPAVPAFRATNPAR